MKRDDGRHRTGEQHICSEFPIVASPEALVRAKFNPPTCSLLPSSLVIVLKEKTSLHG
jgi:hypothetical protein